MNPIAAAIPRRNHGIPRVCVPALFEEVDLYHSWPSQGRAVKYMHTTFDNRTGDVWHVEMRCTTGTHTFSTTELEDDGDLFSTVMTWLQTGRTTKRPVPLPAPYAVEALAERAHDPDDTEEEE